MWTGALPGELGKDLTAWPGHCGLRLAPCWLGYRPVCAGEEPWEHWFGGEGLVSWSGNN